MSSMSIMEKILSKGTLVLTSVNHTGVDSGWLKRVSLNHSPE